MLKSQGGAAALDGQANAVYVATMCLSMNAPAAVAGARKPCSKAASMVNPSWVAAGACRDLTLKKWGIKSIKKKKNEVADFFRLWECGGIGLIAVKQKTQPEASG